MEPQSNFGLNGQEVQIDDLTTMATAAALADDHVLAEMFRLTPYAGSGVTKAILPASSPTPTVSPIAGGVSLAPFRALIGSRALEAAGGLANFRDMRSAIFTGTTTRSATTALAANSSGNPRWDLVYAILSPDADGSSFTRMAKDPASGAVTPQTVVTKLVTTLTIAVVTGVTGASPAFPALPADTATAYNIPLAYVRVATGFVTGTTVVNTADINDVAPIAPISRTTGAASLVPANQNNAPGGTVLSSTGFAFTATSGQRPSAFIPPTMIGKEELIIYMDLQSGTAANRSHQNGQVVDSSRDWSNRLFKWTAFATNISSYSSAWDSTNANQFRVPCAGGQIPSVAGVGASTTYQYGMGQSLYPDGFAVVAGTHPVKPLVLALSNVAGVQNFSCMPSTAGTWVTLYVDAGVLKVFINGTPGIKIFIWLDASAPYGNY